LIAAILVATGTIISQSKTIRNLIFPPKPLADLVDVNLAYPPILPFRFRDVIGKSPYLKWFHLKVDNHSGERLHVLVTFRVRRGPATETSRTPFEDYINPHQLNFERDPDPNIEFLRNDVRPNDVLEINYHVFDNEHKVDFSSKTTQPPIDLLPNNEIDWALTALDGSPVPQDFLLASLTTWTVTAEPSVKQRTDQFRREVGQLVDASSVTRWFARCYDQVFHNPSGIRVSPAPIPFPAPGRQTIHTASQVLDNGQADPLEAALLLGALSRDTFRNRLRLVLFATPEAQGQPAQKSVLLSWSTDSQAWHALDLARANSLSFEDNQKLATDHVGKLLAEQPEILSALDGSGVFFDKARPTIALDFRRADQNFHFTAWQ
jgi:hypothetical protein